MPIVIGEGIEATKSANRAGASSHTSTSMAAPFALGAAQSRLGRVGRQRVQPVARCRASGTQKAGAPVRQLVVQRLAREVRTDHGQGDARW